MEFSKKEIGLIKWLLEANEKFLINNYFRQGGLVALIEKEGDYSKDEYRIIDFLFKMHREDGDVVELFSKDELRDIGNKLFRGSI